MDVSARCFPKSCDGHLQTRSATGLLLFHQMTNFIISKSDSVAALSVGLVSVSCARGSFLP